MSEALITKYRPQKFDEVIGHSAAIKSLKNVVAKKSSTTFLFSGSPGTGKTTLARITATALGCLPADLLEIDAATATGIDDMRAVTSGLMYKPLGEGTVKAIIVDECQALSKAAVSSLLKILEEPPPWVIWALCTTEPTKLPEAIRTRCTRYELKPVALEDLVELLDDVVAKEKLTVSETIVDLCAKEAGGSPRQALSNLALCSAATSTAEAKELLRSAAGSEEAVALARALIKGVGWSEMQQILEGLKDTSSESIRHVVRAYVTKVALTSQSEASVGRALEILAEFSQPFHPADGISPVTLACGQLVLGG